jgi:hypothetical protein
MRLTLAVLQIPASLTTVVLVGIFATPSMLSGGGSPLLVYAELPVLSTV